MNLKDSTLQYRKGYLKRLERFEKEAVQPVKKSKGLGEKDKDVPKEATMKSVIDEELQKAFNMIRENNLQMLAMKEKEESRNGIN